MDRKEISRRMLDLTLEIITLLSGEDYTLVKKTSGRTPIIQESGGRTPITEPPPLIHEEKILELTHKMMELLTGEVPVRCQDVAVYFSMEEWEYIEGQEDLYEEAMMEEPRPRTSESGCSEGRAAETYRRPGLPQDYSEGNPSFPLDEQGEDMKNIDVTTIIIKEEPDVEVDQLCEEDISTDNDQDDFTRSLERPPISSDDGGITQDAFQEFAIIPHMHSPLNSKDLSSGPFKWVLANDSSQFSCLESGNCFNQETIHFRHERSHTGEKRFSCSECGKGFTRKTSLVRHERIHTGTKPFSCSECGRCFTLKSNLVMHEKIHTGEKSYSCPDCGKRFTVKSSLVRHHRIHTGEKPYSCSGCGKCFTNRSDLVIHERIHTGEKPYSCSECGKCFSVKSSLLSHKKIHAGEKLF